MSMPPYFPQPFPHQLPANPANFTSRLSLFHICGTILALGLELGLRSGARCVTQTHKVFVVKEEKEEDGGSATMASTIPYTVMEGFIHIYAKLSVYLHPSRAANVQQGVREIMNSLLLRKVFLLFSVSRFVCFLFGKFDFSFCGAGEHLQRANRYNEEFEGVVLVYLDPKIQGPTANILSGLSPYFHVQLKGSFLLFSPKIGMLVGN
ncbi:hypothetical protein BDL97_09G035800 [Sphagnum fallax]|nr:hypothetical protein BDL97_09G035800 [Sphagnum fallax]